MAVARLATGWHRCFDELLVTDGGHGLENKSELPRFYGHAKRGQCPHCSH